MPRRNAYVLKKLDFNAEITGIRLLTEEEFKECLSIIPVFGSCWWLNSRGEDGKRVRCGMSVPAVCDGCQADYTYTMVRPVITFTQSDMVRGDRLEIFGYNWTAISGEAALCDCGIARHIFNADVTAQNANCYEGSDIQKFMEDWLREREPEKGVLYRRIKTEILVDEVTLPEAYLYKKYKDIIPKVDKDLWLRTPVNAKSRFMYVRGNDQTIIKRGAYFKEARERIYIRPVIHMTYFGERAKTGDTVELFGRKYIALDDSCVISLDYIGPETFKHVKCEKDTYYYTTRQQMEHGLDEWLHSEYMYYYHQYRSC
ncbi:MAG: hypothetical protein K6F92_01990 [Lachnospiraceae bacterium]|nr:hypothetical protein [Lachnospiraceae bacterium]